MKVGIYSPWASGDAILSTMVFKYKALFWPNSHLVWFIVKKTTSHSATADIVYAQPAVDEVRLAEEPFSEIIKLRVGHSTNSFGHPLSVSKKNAGRMLEAYRTFKSLYDLDLCYFPAPWANCNMLNGQFALASNAVFNYPENPHPCLEFTAEEDQSAEAFVSSLPFSNSVMLETKCGSGQSGWCRSTSELIIMTCRQVMGNCNFIFASPGGASDISGPGITDCSEFTIRQCIPIYNRCRLFVSTSSAIAIATCSWSSNPAVRRIDFTNNPLITTKPISMGKTRWTSNEKELPSLVRKSLEG